MRAELRFVERRSGRARRASASVAPCGSRGLVEIFEVRGELVDRMRPAGRRRSRARFAQDDLAPVGHGRYPSAVLTPATRPSAAMNRAQSSRWAARTRRPRVGDPVVAAPPLARLLDPAPAQPAAILEAVQRRVERGEREAWSVPSDRASICLRNVVAVERLILDERQDQELRAAFLRFANRILRHDRTTICMESMSNWQM